MPQALTVIKMDKQREYIWISMDKYKHTKNFYDGPDNNKAKGVLTMGTLNLWIKCITGHNNLAYFRSKIDAAINPACRLYRNNLETSIYHLLSTCNAMHGTQQELGMIEIPTPGREWSIKRISKFIDSPAIHNLLRYDT